MDELLHNDTKIQLCDIFYLAGDGKISVLAEGTNGPNFVVRESGVGPTTHMSTFIQLINALMSIQRYFTEDLASSWPVMVSYCSTFTLKCIVFKLLKRDSLDVRTCQIIFQPEKSVWFNYNYLLCSLINEGGKTGESGKMHCLIVKLMYHIITRMVVSIGLGSTCSYV